MINTTPNINEITISARNRNSHNTTSKKIRYPIYKWIAKYPTKSTFITTNGDKQHRKLWQNQTKLHHQCNPHHTLLIPLSYVNKSWSSTVRLCQKSNLFSLNSPFESMYSYQRGGLVVTLCGLQDAALGDPGSNPGSK